MSTRPVQAFTAVICLLLIVPTGAAASALLGPSQSAAPSQDQPGSMSARGSVTDSSIDSLSAVVSQADDPEGSNNTTDSASAENSSNETVSGGIGSGINDSTNNSTGTAAENGTTPSNASNTSGVGGSQGLSALTGVATSEVGGTGTDAGTGASTGGPQPISIPQRIGANSSAPANGTNGSGGGAGTNTSGGPTTGDATGNGTGNAGSSGATENASSQSGSDSGLAPSAASDASPGSVGGTGENSPVWDQLDPTGQSGFNVGKSVVDWFFRKWLTSQMRVMFNDLLSAMIGFLVGTPFPTNSGGYGIFGTPTNHPWQAFFNQVYVPIVFTLSIALIVCMTLLQGAEAALSRSLPWRTPTPEELASRALGAFMVVCSWWWVGTLMAKFINGIGRFITPSAPELTGSIEGLIQIGGAGIMTILFTATLGAGEVATLAVLYAIRHAMVMVYLVVMPLILVPALVAPHPKMRGFFGDLAWHYITVLILVLPGAVLMRLGYEASWDFGFSGIGGLLVSLGFFGAGIAAVMLVTWTSVSTKRLANKAASAGEPATDKLDDKIHETSDAFEQRARENKYVPFLRENRDDDDDDEWISQNDDESVEISGADVTVTRADHAD